MNTTQKPIGIYIHVPFCSQKCPYCDFYSIAPKDSTISEYITALKTAMSLYKSQSLWVDTVYFGGGTPSLLGAENLGDILSAVRSIYSVAEEAEITCEINPGGLPHDFFPDLKKAGFNRISLGMQSANAAELCSLGRRHSAEDVKTAVESAQQAGFHNISVDLMLGVPESSAEHLKQSIDFAEKLNIQHISAYMLKIEKGTPFYARQDSLKIPDDDGMADFYQLCSEQLSEKGFVQYEISNFAISGFESRHNLKYWHCEEYLGFGPSAHSFYQGKRFYYPRILQDFLLGKPPVQDGDGGDFEEFAMLNLRLKEGVKRSHCEERFADGSTCFDKMMKNVKKCPPELIYTDDNAIALTSKGFAVSNAVILTLLS